MTFRETRSISNGNAPAPRNGVTLQHDPEVRRICATAYLEHLSTLRAEIDALEEEIAPLRDMTMSAMDYREYVSSSPNPKAFEDAMARLQELVDRCFTEQVGYTEELDVAHGVFLGLSRREYARALKSHYLFCRSWEQVCVDMGYTWSGMMKLRRKAVDEMYDLMPEEWRRNAIPNAAA